MYNVDMLLTGEKFRELLIDISTGKYVCIKTFINEFAKYSDEDYSDTFVYKMQTICRLLVDVRAYDLLAHIIKLSPSIATFEDKEHEGEECIVTYVIKKVSDESTIAYILNHCEGGELTPYFYNYLPPSVAAIDLKKYQTLSLLFNKKLCDEKFCYGKYTALQYAVLNKNYEFAEYLLTKLNHNVDLCGALDLAPLALAADADDFQMAKLLLGYGADASVIDGNGKSAMDYCHSQKMVDLLTESKKSAE